MTAACVYDLQDRNMKYVERGTDNTKTPNVLVGSDDVKTTGKIDADCLSHYALTFHTCKENIQVTGCRNDKTVSSAPRCVLKKLTCAHKFVKKISHTQ